MAKILAIDDEDDCLVQLQVLLAREGHEVFPLMRATRVREEIRSLKPDLVITDIMMPGISGSSVYEMIRNEIGPLLPVIVSSATRPRISAPACQPHIPTPCHRRYRRRWYDTPLWMVFRHCPKSPGPGAERSIVIAKS